MLTHAITRLLDTRFASGPVPVNLGVLSRFSAASLPGITLGDLADGLPLGGGIRAGQRTEQGFSLTREGFEAMVRSSSLDSDIPDLHRAPVELKQLVVAARLDLIPRKFVDGIGDVVSQLPEPPSPSSEEIMVKRARISQWLEAQGADVLEMNDLYHQAWLTGGLRFDEITGQTVAKLLIPKDLKEPITIIISNIEEPRIIREELIKNFGEQWGDHFKLEVYPWHEAADKSCYVSQLVGKLTQGKNVQTDGKIGFDELHYSFLLPDIARYEWLAQAATAALNKAALFIRFGEDTEADVAGRIQKMLAPYEIFPEVLLVAGDDRVSSSAHQLPRQQNPVIKNYAAMVLCARWHGYIVNLSRFVSNGEVPEETQKSLSVCAEIAQIALEATRPGQRIGDIFYEAFVRKFGECGYPGAYKDVHQGGPTGIGIRDFPGTGGCEAIVQPHQPYTWNPILRGIGVKVEETFITGANADEPSRILTANDPYGWWPRARFLNDSESQWSGILVR